MKVERFIKEYANFIKKQENVNVAYVDKILKARENGLITIQETMQALTTYLQEYRYIPESFL